VGLDKNARAQPKANRAMRIQPARLQDDATGGCRAMCRTELNIFDVGGARYSGSSCTLFTLEVVLFSKGPPRLLSRLQAHASGRSPLCFSE
jgi:hypothetical protein